LDAIQAGILQAKLRYLPEWNGKRRQIAARYNELLSASTSLVLPCEPPWSHGVYHLYVVRTAKRDQLQEYLTKFGIGTGIHYPVPVHLQKPYRNMGFKEGDFPVTEKAAAEVLSLPMYPGLGLAEQDCVARQMARFENTAESPVPVQPAVKA